MRENKDLGKVIGRFWLKQKEKLGQAKRKLGVQVEGRVWGLEEVS